jgi:aspartate--ammonia ligase
MSTIAKEADLAGPGVGDYAELARVLPPDYVRLLTPLETMEALYGAKRVVEDGLCAALGLTMVQVPLIVDRESGVNDYLDRDGSRTPVTFHMANDRDLHPIDAEVVQAATGAPPVRDGAGRRSAHRHARGTQGLLPRP